jgi:hypothetical protein
VCAQQKLSEIAEARLVAQLAGGATIERAIIGITENCAVGAERCLLIARAV